MLEKTPESPLDCKEIQPVHAKGDQSWVVFGRTDVKAEAPILWPPHSKSWLIGKDSDAERDWGQEEKGMTEDEMAGWHHWLDGHESGWTPGVGDGQGGLACCNSWGRKESDTTEWLNWTELNTYKKVAKIGHRIPQVAFSQISLYINLWQICFSFVFSLSFTIHTHVFFLWAIKYKLHTWCPLMPKYFTVCFLKTQFFFT